MKKTIVIHKDWLIPTAEMTDEEYRAYMQAIFDYAFEGKLPDDRGMRMLLKLVSAHIDGYEAKYDKAVQQRKEAARKRWERYREEHTDEYDRMRSNADEYERIRGIREDAESDTESDTGVPDMGTDKEKPANAGKKKVAAATAAPVAPRQESKEKKFIRPTVGEVRAYCAERGNGVSAEAFCDFYESKGWRVGSSLMKDWRAAVRTWEKRDGRDARKAATKDGARLGEGEWIDEQGNRRYGSGKTAPMDAPPRPGPDYYWSRETDTWIAGV